jgi:WD40 repeat protein
MGTQWVFVRFNSFADSTNVAVIPPGRLVVWSSFERVVRLVNLNGSNERLLLTDVDSDLGAFPRFDPTRQRVTFYAGSPFGRPNHIIVIDTTGSPRRDINAATGFSLVIATRQLADGTVLVVGQTNGATSHPGIPLWSVATDNTITFLAALPDLGQTYGGADISHNGNRVAYVANTGASATELRVLDVSSGSTIVLEPGTASSPRWSAQDDRVAYLVPGNSGSIPPFGALVVTNADGTGRNALGDAPLSPGLGWSPDGKYIVGRPVSGGALRLLRLSDGANVILKFSGHDYWQPDWR